MIVAQVASIHSTLTFNASPISFTISGTMPSHSFVVGFLMFHGLYGAEQTRSVPLSFTLCNRLSCCAATDDAEVTIQQPAAKATSIAVLCIVTSDEKVCRT